MIVPDLSTAPTVVVRRDGPMHRRCRARTGAGPGWFGSATSRVQFSDNESVQVFYALDANSNIGTKFCRFKLTRFHFPIFVPKPVQMKLKFNSTGMGGDLGIVSLFSDAF